MNFTNKIKQAWFKTPVSCFAGKMLSYVGTPLSAPQGWEGFSLVAGAAGIAITRTEAMRKNTMIVPFENVVAFEPVPVEEVG